MRRKICVLIVILCMLAATGCTNGVSGTYKATVPTGQTLGFNATIVLKSNGSCTITKTISDQVVSEYKGSYSVEDNVITFSLTWKTDTENEGEYTGTILKSGNIRLKFFGETLTYYKS